VASSVCSASSSTSGQITLLRCARTDAVFSDNANHRRSISFCRCRWIYRGHCQIRSQRAGWRQRQTECKTPNGKPGNMGRCIACLPTELGARAPRSHIAVPEVAFGAGAKVMFHMRLISELRLYKIEQCRNLSEVRPLWENRASVQFYTDPFPPCAQAPVDSRPLSEGDRTAFRLLLFRPASEKRRFGARAEQVGGTGSVMLIQESPSAITTKMLCPLCGDCLRLAVVEPHYNGKRLDRHIFACSACNEIQTYVFDRTLSVSRPPSL
jgi:hypothetical protein